MKVSVTQGEFELYTLKEFRSFIESSSIVEAAPFIDLTMKPDNEYAFQDLTTNFMYDCFLKGILVGMDA